eukprot:5563091-Lingulodinium_polyedra.AAC.1
MKCVTGPWPGVPGPVAAVASASPSRRAGAPAASGAAPPGCGGIPRASLLPGRAAAGTVSSATRVSPRCAGAGAAWPSTAPPAPARRGPS